VCINFLGVREIRKGNGIIVEAEPFGGLGERGTCAIKIGAIYFRSRDGVERKQFDVREVECAIVVG